MPTIVPAHLADGQLPSTRGTLYTCPPSTVVTITEMSLVNNNAATQTVRLRVNRSGNSYRIFYCDSFGQYWQAHGGAGIVLQPGDLIEGATTTASAVDYNIDGLVQT